MESLCAEDCKFIQKIKLDSQAWVNNKVTEAKPLDLYLMLIDWVESLLIE